MGEHEDAHRDSDIYFDYIRSHPEEAMTAIIDHLQRGDFSTSATNFPDMSPMGLASDLYNIYVVLCVDESDPQRLVQNSEMVLKFLVGIKEQFPQTTEEFPDVDENYNKFYENLDSFIERLT